MTNYPLEMWKPGAATTGPTGERRPTYSRVVLRGELMRSGGGVIEEAELSIPDRSRQYAVRYDPTITTGWFLREGEGQWFRVIDVAPMPGRRRNGWLKLTLTFTGEVPEGAQ